MWLGQLLTNYFRYVLTPILWKIEKIVKILIVFFSIKNFLKRFIEGFGLSPIFFQLNISFCFKYTIACNNRF